MGISEQYTDDRLDRLAGAIRDEVASRREETFGLRTKSTGEMANTTLWRSLLAAGMGLVVVLSMCAHKADAAPLMSSPSTRHHLPASVAVMRVRTDQRFDDLRRKIDVGSSQTAEDLRHLRSQMKQRLEDLDDDSRTREVLLFWLASALALGLFFTALAIKF
jgi:hypothetical protein